MDERAGGFAIPADAEEVQREGVVAVAYLYERNGKLYGIGFGGKRSKPDFHYRFRAPEQRLTHVNEWLNRLQTHAQRPKRTDNTRRDETKLVKEALAEAGINAKVSHNRGTAYGWLDINIGSGQQWGEHKRANPQDRCDPTDCKRCANSKAMQEKAIAVTQRVTGRHGNYDGNISLLTQDHWNDRLNRSEPITHPDWQDVSIGASLMFEARDAGELLEVSRAAMQAPSGVLADNPESYEESRGYVFVHVADHDAGVAYFETQGLRPVAITTR